MPAKKSHPGLWAGAALLLFGQACGPPSESGEYMPLDGRYIGVPLEDVMAEYPNLSMLEGYDHSECGSYEDHSPAATYRYRLPDGYYASEHVREVVQSVRADCEGTVRSVGASWSLESDGFEQQTSRVRALYREMIERLPAEGPGQQSRDEFGHVRYTYLDVNGAECALWHNYSSLGHECGSYVQPRR